MGRRPRLDQDDYETPGAGASGPAGAGNCDVFPDTPVAGAPLHGEKKLPEHVLQQLQASYGLDQAPLVQYGRYWWNMLVHGDLGPSLVKEGVSVADMIGQSFPVSLQLGVIGMAISILAGIPAGIVAALYKNRWMDWWVMLVSMAGICIPAFVVAPLLGVALGMHVPGLSVAGWDSPGCVVLPALTLGLVNAAYLARLTRGGMLEVLGQDFIRTARAKGRGLSVRFGSTLCEAA